MNELATRYSEACTRAGIAALVVAAVSFSFSQRLAKVESLEAFGSYVLARELLATSLEELTTNQFWNAITVELKRDPATIDTITIDELTSLECVTSNNKGQYTRKRQPPIARFSPAGSREIGGIIAAANAQSATSKIETSNPRAPNKVSTAPIPMAPTSIVIESVEQCPGIDVLQGALHTLWDEPRIELARSFSDEVNLELYRWQLGRNRIANGRITATSVGDNSYAHLELRQLRKLNMLDRTTVAQFAALVRERMIVTGPYSSDQQSIGVASTLAEIVTFILVAYFFFNYRSSQRANLLTESGSIFSTLWVNVLGKLFYLLLLVLPAMAAVHLALNMKGKDKTIALCLSGISALITCSLIVKFLAELDSDHIRNVILGLCPKFKKRLHRKN